MVKFLFQSCKTPFRSLRSHATYQVVVSIPAAVTFNRDTSTVSPDRRSVRCCGTDRKMCRRVPDT